MSLEEVAVYPRARSLFLSLYLSLPPVSATALASLSRIIDRGIALDGDLVIVVQVFVRESIM